jgi:hypothetical protein
MFKGKIQKFYQESFTADKYFHESCSRENKHIKMICIPCIAKAQLVKPAGTLEAPT